MKKLLIAIAVSFAVAVQAGWQVSKLDGSPTATVLASTTNTYDNVILGVGTSTTLTLGLGFACAGTNGNQMTTTWESTFDGSHWTALLTWLVYATNTTPVFYSTNLSSLSSDVQAVRLRTFGNANTNVASKVLNLLVGGSTKPNL